MNRTSMPARWRDGLIFAILILAIWLPRGLALDRFVTVDEPKWLARSGNFYLALVQGNLADTFTREHPGVTVTWAGMIGLLWHYPDYVQDAPGQLTDSSQIEPVIRDHGKQPLQVLAAGRVVMVILVTLVLAVAFYTAVQLLGFVWALAGFALIAFDPFHLALSRLLHLDGLVSSLMLLSILAFLTFTTSERRGRNKFLVLSGIAAGLAWLTKSPAFFLVPFVGLVTLIDLLRKQRLKRSSKAGEVRRSAAWLAIWTAAGALVFVLLWPAMWVSPVNTLKRVFGEATTYAEEGHSTDVYFNGAVISSDPGRVFNPAEQHLYGPWAKVRIVGDEGHLFYPITYLWRATPVVLVGLALAALGVFFRRGVQEESNHRWVVGVLILFAFLYTLFMSLGSKKFDRYLLPVYAPLDLVAGMGWVMAARWLAEQIPQIQTRLALPVLLGAVVLTQAYSALRTYPYYLSYYNPLVGGSEQAPRVMMVGWGEGLDQAARYLNEKPDAQGLKVMSWYEDGPFSYVFQGKSLGAASEWEDTRRRLSNVDYVVIYIHQWQRQLPFSEMLKYFSSMQPEHTIYLNGLEYAQIYHISGLSQ
ncbi:MAG: phospholipid carrier-dependent glycosyltransferase [Anaerolineales bacterium]